MTYSLEELLTIRRHRELAALNHMLKIQKELKQTKQLRQKKTEQMSEYKNWRKSEEQRLFNELIQQPRNWYDIEKFNQYIKVLREKQNLLVEDLKQTEKAILQEKAKLEESQKEYAQRYRSKQKLQEHKNCWMQVKYFQDEHRQDDEQDEFSTNIKAHARTKPIY